MALQLRGGPVVGCHFEFWTRRQRKVRGFNDCVIEFKAREDGEDARRRRFCSIRGFVCVSQPLLAQGEWAKKGRDQALKGGQLLRMLLSWMVEKPLLLLPSRVVTAICRSPFFFLFLVHKSWPLGSFFLGKSQKSQLLRKRGFDRSQKKEKKKDWHGALLGLQQGEEDEDTHERRADAHSDRIFRRLPFVAARSKKDDGKEIRQGKGC